VETPEKYWVRELSVPVLDIHGPSLDKDPLDPNVSHILQFKERVIM